MLAGRSIVLAHGVRADGSSLSAVVEKLQTASLDWRDSPFVSTLSAISVEIGRLSPSTDWGSRSISRVNPYLATVVQFLGMLDKLGVTGSSPVPPTSKPPKRGCSSSSVRSTVVDKAPEDREPARRS
jgi:hypothetical protein